MADMCVADFHFIFNSCSLAVAYHRQDRRAKWQFIFFTYIVVYVCYLRIVLLLTLQCNVNCQDVRNIIFIFVNVGTFNCQEVLPVEKE